MTSFQMLAIFLLGVRKISFKHLSAFDVLFTQSFHLTSACVSSRTQLSSHPMCCVEEKHLTIIPKLDFLEKNIKNARP